MLFAALLLIFKGTATIGAFIILIFMGNVFLVNFLYDGGELVYSFYLVLIAAAIVAHDLRRLYRLLVSEEETSPEEEVPIINMNLYKREKIIPKLAIMITIF